MAFAIFDPRRVDVEIKVKSSSFVTIVNKGQAVAGSSYFDTQAAKRGYYFLSWNAGAGRLLMPDGSRRDLREMKTAKYVVISVGPWPERGGRIGLELLFEDHSDSPFVLFMSAEQTDRLLPDADQGGGFDVTVWTRDGEKLRLPGKYRKVSQIPCMDEWKHN